MKKTCFALLCALLLGLAPSVFATDVASAGSFDGLLSRLVALFSSYSGEAEVGIEIVPTGQSAVDGPETGALPPNSNSLTEPDPEMGWEYPPGS